MMLSVMEHPLDIHTMLGTRDMKNKARSSHWWGKLKKETVLRMHRERILTNSRRGFVEVDKLRQSPERDIEVSWGNKGHWVGRRLKMEWKGCASRRKHCFKDQSGMNIDDVMWKLKVVQYGVRWERGPEVLGWGAFMIPDSTWDEFTVRGCGWEVFMSSYKVGAGRLLERFSI